MPIKIPVYQQQTMTDGTLASPHAQGVGVSNAEAQGLGAIGQGLGSVAEGFTVRQKILQDREDQNALMDIRKRLSELEVNRSRWLRDSMQSAPEGAYGFTDFVSKRIDEDNVKFLETIANPKAKDYATLKLLELKKASLNHAMTFEAASGVKNSEVQLDSIKENYKRVAIDGASIDDVQRMFVEYDEAISGSRFLRPEIKTILSENGKGEIAKAYINGLLVTNPSKASELIKSGAFSKYLKAEEVTTLEKKAEELNKAQGVTNYHAFLSAKYKDSDGKLDYSKIDADVMNPDVYLKQGLTAHQAGEVFNLFNAQRVREEALHKQKQDKNADNLWLRVTSQKEPASVLVQEIKRAVVNQDIDRGDGDKFIEKIMNPTVKTDAATYLRLMEQILDNRTDLQGNKAAIRKSLGRLSTSDAEGLFKMAYAKENALEDKTLKSNVDFIKSQLAPSKGLLVGGSPGESDNLKKATDSFLEKVEAAKKGGNTLTPKDYDDIARQTVRAYQPDIYKRLEWQKESINGQQSKTPKSTKNKTMPDLWDEVSRQGSSSKGINYLINTYGYSDQQAQDIISQGIKQGQVK